MKCRKGRPGAGASPAGSKGNYNNIELYSGNGNQSLAVGKRTALDIWRFMRPYGTWTCADGRQVLFNRDYLPILERYPGQPCRPANPREWVNWEKQSWLYNDGTPFKVALMNAALADWGLPPMPPMPSGRVSPGSRAIRREWPNPYGGVLAS